MRSNDDWDNGFEGKGEPERGCPICASYADDDQEVLDEIADTARSVHAGTHVETEAEFLAKEGVSSMEEWREKCSPGWRHGPFRPLDFPWGELPGKKH